MCTYAWGTAPSQSTCYDRLHAWCMCAYMLGICICTCCRTCIFVLPGTCRCLVELFGTQILCSLFSADLAISAMVCGINRVDSMFVATTKARCISGMRANPDGKRPWFNKVAKFVCPRCGSHIWRCRGGMKFLTILQNDLPKPRCYNRAHFRNVLMLQEKAADVYQNRQIFRYGDGNDGASDADLESVWSESFATSFVAHMYSYSWHGIGWKIYVHMSTHAWKSIALNTHVAACRTSTSLEYSYQRWSVVLIEFIVGQARVSSVRNIHV